MLDHNIHGAAVPPIVACDRLAKKIESKQERCEKLTAKLYQITNKRCIPTEKKVMAALGELIDRNVAESDQGLKAAERTYHAGLSSLAIGTVVGVVLAIVFGVVIALSVSRPVSRCVAFAEAMAAGDLTRTLEVTRKDEIGHLVTALNTMGANLRQMFGQIVANTATLAGAANRATPERPRNLASGAEETTTQSTTVAAAAEEMSANMTTWPPPPSRCRPTSTSVASAWKNHRERQRSCRSAEQAAGWRSNAARLADDSNARRSTELGHRGRPRSARSSKSSRTSPSRPTCWP